MKATSEELMKLTRSELEEMAKKLGLMTVGISKSKIADMILEGKKKQKAPQPVKPLMKRTIAKKGVCAKRSAIKAQRQENREAVANIFSGVQNLHKEICNFKADMDNKSHEIQKDVMEFHMGVMKYQKCIAAQRKENQNAIANFFTGVKELQNGIMAFQGEIRTFQGETAKYIQDFYYG